MNEVIQDVLSAAGYSYYNDKEMTEVLEDLICEHSWKSEIEAYEYISYMLRLTQIATDMFPEAGRDLWEPVIRYYFGYYSYILDNTEDAEYSMLANYYPLSPALSECKGLLAKLSALTTLNKETRGVASEVSKDMGRLLCESLMTKFTEATKSSRYMSEDETITVYKTMVLNSLNYVAALEKTDPAEGISPIHPKQVQVAEEKPSEVPVALVQAKITPVKKSAEKKITELRPEKTDKIQEISHPVEPAVREATIIAECDEKPSSGTCHCKIDQKSVDKLLDGKVKSLDEYIDLFVAQFQSIESLFYVYKRTKQADDMAFCQKTLELLFESFDTWYEKASNSHPVRGLQPDMEKWNRTANNIKTFKKKASA